MGKKIVVIGGGASGMMSAIMAAEDNENEVVIYEKNEKLGKKIYITGKGRCNVTNNSDVDNLLNNTIGNPYFMYSAYYSFNSQNVMEFFEGEGLNLKTERGNRVFPKSDKSNDVIRTLEKKLRKNNVKIRLNSEVEKLICEDKKIVGLIVNGVKTLCDKIIVATGGLSYSSTGSTGDGYKFAKDLGIKVTNLSPSLVPLKVKEEFAKDLQGLSLKNIKVTLKINNKKIYSHLGEMMFTHFGITGPLILTSSRYLVGSNFKNTEMFIDLKPSLSEGELDNRILRDFKKYNNKDFKNGLKDLLPQKIVDTIIKLSLIDPDKKINEITKSERNNLVKVLKNLKITIIDSNGYNQAVVTSGGISVDELNPSTCESKKIRGLFFVGEVIDVDCLTGGYNMQVAFSTGYLAGVSC